MEENIDLEPQLHAMMCPDMAVRGSANSQMLLGSGPGAAPEPPTPLPFSHGKAANKYTKRLTLFTVLCQDSLPSVQHIPAQSVEKEEKPVGC